MHTRLNIRDGAQNALNPLRMPQVDSALIGRNILRQNACYGILRRIATHIRLLIPNLLSR
jgi:hypothetical protein